MTAQLPLDLTSLPPFRAMEAKLGPASALFLWWTAWRELAYLTQEGVSAGRIRVQDRAPFVQGLSDGSEGKNGTNEALWNLLVESRLLKADGEDWVCVRFAALNGGGGGSRSSAQRGGDMRAFQARQRRLDGEAFQQGLLLGDKVMVTSDGAKLPEGTQQRVTRLIIACDNALFQPQRAAHGYTEGLVQDALRVLARFSDEEIDRVVRFVASKRNHALLSTTEKLLPKFAEIVPLLEGQA
jgi:hypothetical protein